MFKQKIVEKKSVILIISILTIFSLAFNFFVFLDESKIKPTKCDSSVINDRIKWNIDSIKIGNSVKIRGWALVQNEIQRTLETYIILKDTNSGKCVKIPTEGEERTDLKNMFNDACDYTNSGFIANVTLDNINIKKNNYEILIHYKSNNKDYIIETGKYIKE